MKFGPVAIEDAEGAVLAHATVAGDRRLKKSHRLTRDDIDALRAAGIAEVVAAVLADDDLDENAAAAAIASALGSAGIQVKPAATGRVNLHAEHAGVFTVDRAIVDDINRIHPSITLATLAPFAAVAEGQMVATVKIIPFAVSQPLVEAAVSVAERAQSMAVHGFAAKRLGIVQTVLAGTKPGVLDKTVQVTAARLARSGSSVSEEVRVPHRSAEVSDAVTRLLPDNDMVVVFGASAMSDPGDVIPAAIENAGGTVLRTGMPVDPGNLIVLGEIAGKPVLGAPGCARSPKENGFDWVLDRLIAGLPVTGDDIAGMGVGGLLMEIATRPQPRETPARPMAIHAAVMAAGRSSRMGGPNKLLARFDGEPLVRRVVERTLASKASGLTIIVGHQARDVRDALQGLSINIVENQNFADGLSTSVRAGVAAAPASVAGLLVVLGDMPDVTTADLDRLIAAFSSARGAVIVRAASGGKRGNPVILPRSAFADVGAIEGDAGARSIIESGKYEVIDVDIGAGAMVDVDTPEALAKAGGKIQAAT